MTHIRYAQFIWERVDWPCFRWNAQELLSPLSRLCDLHGQLQGKMSTLGFQKQGAVSLDSMMNDLLSTSEIEGVVLSSDSVRSSIGRRLGIAEDGLLVEDHYVEGLVEVMFDAWKNCKDPLDKERLFSWNMALFPTGRSGMHSISVGKWRVGEEPMQVVSGAFGHEKLHFQAPPSKDVDYQMGSLIQWINSCDESPFLMAAVAHLWFLTIHPFDDGNGRIARTLADMILARNNASGEHRYYSVSAEINSAKREYYEILERTQKGDLDITEWILWFFRRLENAIQRTLEKIDRILSKTKYWDKFSEQTINERQRKVINRLWDGFEGKLTTSKWAKICHCSQDTALRDITDLIAKGMLKPGEGSGRSSHYVLVE